MSSVSGLSAEHREVARDRTMQAAFLALRNRDRVWYSQGSSRWQGINTRRNPRLGQYPSWCDCSSFTTWCLWAGLYLPYGVRDTVNAANWRYGYTGTQRQHGKVVKDHDNIKRGDLAHYGPGTGKHVAICVGGGKVISMGSNAGPVLVGLHYRNDLHSIRRYI